MVFEKVHYMKPHHKQFLHTLGVSQQLPTLPHILIKLTDLCNRDDAQYEDLAQIIMYDAPLCATILGAWRSAEYDSSQKIGDVHQALHVLNINSLKTVILQAAFHRVLEKDSACASFSLQGFWGHSVLCAHLSEALAKTISCCSPGRAFLSGLLHDIGKLILAIHFPWEYDQILLRTHDNTEMLLAEEERLGASHSEIGAWMLNQWNLDPFISDAVLYHHESAERIRHAFPLVKILYAANILSKSMVDNDESKIQIAAGILELSESDVKGVLTDAKDKVNEIAHSFDIDLDLHKPVSQKASFSNHQQQQELSQRLTSTARDISLLYGASRSLFRTSDADSIMSSFQQGLQALFNIGKSLLFFYDKDKDMLIPRQNNSFESGDAITEAAIPLKRDKSMLVSALFKGIPVNSIDYQKTTPLTIIDEQILHATRGEVLFCVPVVFEEQFFGVIAMGIDESRLFQLKKQLQLVTMFSNQAALALHVNRLGEQQPSLSQKQQFTAASIMTRKVAHEVRTPLNIIKNYLKILERKISVANGGADEFKIINEEIDRVAVILDEFADDSQFKFQSTDTIDFNALISEVVTMFKESSLLGPHIAVHIEHDHRLPLITTDKNAMKQVLMNLMQNAIDALARGGTIQIATRYVPYQQKDEGRLAVGDDFKSDCVEMIMRDNGPGIPDRLKQRLSEPYFTTKGEKHAGLGLYIVQNIVENLKGSITYESKEEVGGTSVRVVLPISAPGIK
jgi:putative nucleotidyltransferase with HDIG domain